MRSKGIKSKNSNSQNQVQISHITVVQDKLADNQLKKDNLFNTIDTTFDFTEAQNTNTKNGY